MKYNPPAKGKFGIYSALSKRKVFGICCDTKKECFDELKKHIGYDAQKYRWKCSLWTDSDLQAHFQQKEEYKDFIENRKLEVQKLKENKKYIAENLHKLSENQLEKFKSSGRYPIGLHNHKDAVFLFNNIINGITYKES